MNGGRIPLGRAGEEAAARHLKKKGLRLAHRNYRCRLGELDIVARDGPFLVFVEVRTVAGGAFGAPQESIGSRKVQKIRQLAAYYMLSEKTGDVPVRFDVVAVTMDRDGRLLKLDHILNAF